MRLPRHPTLALPFALACLIIGGSAISTTTLRAQAKAQDQPQPVAKEPPVREMLEDEKKARAETQRLVHSSKTADREEAVQRLAAFYMDYQLLWQLMNDADRGVRLMAISAMTWPSCTCVPDRPLSTELAQKMAAMLEKEVTPERIRAAFEPGHIQAYETGLVASAAETLDHLYSYESLAQSPDDYATWQQRVLKPLFYAAARGYEKGAFSEQLHACQVNVLRRIRDPALFQEALTVVIRSLDSPDVPSPALLETLRALWSYHDLLGSDRPLHLLLVMLVSPRLESLRSRILAPMKEGQDKEQAALLLSYYAEAIQTVREKMPASPSQPKPKQPPAGPPSPPAAGAAKDSQEQARSEPPPAPEAAPPAPSQAEREKKRAEIHRLAASTVIKDRVSAAAEMVSEGIDHELNQKLLHDPDYEVSETALETLVMLCHEKPSPMSLEQARQMAALLEPEVTEERITHLYEGDSAQAKHHVFMACYAALALNQLYQHHAVLPSPVSYSYWQEKVLRALVIYTTNDYRDPGGENDELVLEVIRAISTPAALQQTVDLLKEYPNLDDISAARQLSYLEVLWTHPLLGEGRPMNPLLLQALATVWDPVRDHILRNTRDKDRSPDQKTVQFLGRIDAAYRALAKQLLPEPATAKRPAPKAARK